MHQEWTYGAGSARGILPAVVLLCLGLPVLGNSCQSETRECSGILVGSECLPCPGEMVDGVCLTGLKDVEGQTCYTDDDCLPGAVCLHGLCGTECTQTSQCPGHQE